MAWHKYRAVKTKVNGKTFTSKLEAAVFVMLTAMSKAGEIEWIELQAKVYMTDAKILFKPDFKCTKPDGSVFYVEAKGSPTPSYNIKRRLWLAGYGAQAPLHVYGGGWQNLKLMEILIPGQKPLKTKSRAAKRNQKKVNLA